MSASPVPLLRSPLLSTVPGIAHGFSTRAGGVSAGRRLASLNLGGSRGDDPSAVRENRRRLAAAFGRPVEAVALGEQRHGSEVVLATAESGVGLPAGGRGYQGVDALITPEPGLLLTVLAADCVPILIATGDGRAVAAVHAGWRGTAAGVAGKAVRAMSERCGAVPGRLLVAVGPSIGPCCYEVDGPVIAAFGEENAALRPGRPRHAMLDLRAANVAQLIEAGVDANRIDVLPYCTACRRDLFYSARGDSEPTGRFGGGIVISL